jgi:hypothetical protein
MNKIFNYTLSDRIYNSDYTLAKIAKYSLVVIALVVIVETIKNIVLTPFILTSNFYNLKPKDKKNIESLNQVSLFSESSSKKLQENNQQKINLKKIVIGISIAILSVVTIALYTSLITSKSYTTKDTTTIACEKIFANGFKGEICSETNCKEIDVPPMEPSKYTLHTNESIHFLGFNKTHTICTATLHEEGRKLIMNQITDIPLKISFNLSPPNSSSWVDVSIWWDSNSCYIKKLFNLIKVRTAEL